MKEITCRRKFRKILSNGFLEMDLLGYLDIVKQAKKAGLDGSFIVGEIKRLEKRKWIKIVMLPGQRFITLYR